jgi:cytidylate kinase
MEARLQVGLPYEQIERCEHIVTHVVVFIGGPAGAGKTSIVAHIAKTLDAATHRPHQAFLAVAANRAVPPKRAFDLEYVPELEIWATYRRWCEQESLTVADVHYAIQPTRDSAAGIGADPREELWPWEPYVPAYTKEFIRYLEQARIVVGLVLVTAEPNELVRRLSNRDGGRARSQRASSMAAELAAEQTYFADLVAATKAPALRVDNTSLGIQPTLAVVRSFIERVLSNESNTPC